MCEELVGVGEVDLVGIDDAGEGTPLQVGIGSRNLRPACEARDRRVWSKGYRTAVLVDLPAFGRASASAVAETPLEVSEFPVCKAVVR